MLTRIPPTFQRLIDEDADHFGEPGLVVLKAPEPPNELCRVKLENWLARRGASYQAKRHSEYLYFESDDPEKGPRILISAFMPTPDNMDQYLRQSANKYRPRLKGNRARKAGYTTRRISPAEEAAGIWKIIHSVSQRQGRPVSPMFNDRSPEHDFAEYRDYGDALFNDICCGVFAPDGSLAAYLLGKRVGDHVQYDEIMGHSDHIANDVMYLLHFAFLEMCAASPHPPQCLNYGSWYSGSNPFSPEGGLNRWKRKVKFKPAYLILASS